MKRTTWLILAAILGVALCLTRHAGIGMLVGAIFVLRGSKRWLATLPGILAIVLWMVLVGTGENLPMQSKTTPWPDIWQNLNGYWTYLAALIPFAVVALWQKQRLLLAMAVGWAVTIILTCFVVNLGDTGTRMIIPAATLLMLGLFTLKTKTERWAIGLLVALLTIQSYQILASPRDANSGFNSSAWKKSETLVRLSNINPDEIFSNAPDGLWYWTGRVTQPLPRFDGRPTQVKNPKPMKDACLAVYFKQQMGRSYYGTPDNYVKRVARDTNDAIQIFEYPDAYVMILNAE